MKRGRRKEEREEEEEGEAKRGGREEEEGRGHAHITPGVQVQCNDTNISPARRCLRGARVRGDEERSRRGLGRRGKRGRKE